jgi:hypothetical protein
MLLLLGAGLLRYGLVENPVPNRVYHSSTSSIELN